MINVTVLVDRFGDSLLRLEVLAQKDALKRKLIEKKAPIRLSASAYREHGEENSDFGADEDVPPVVAIVGDAGDGAEEPVEQHDALDRRDEEFAAHTRRSDLQVPDDEDRLEEGGRRVARGKGFRRVANEVLSVH